MQPPPLHRMITIQWKHSRSRTESVISELIIHGPPIPPPGYEIERQRPDVPRETDHCLGCACLPLWVYGCSAVSGAMIAGYYDNIGYRIFTPVLPMAV